MYRGMNEHTYSETLDDDYYEHVYSQPSGGDPGLVVAFITVLFLIWLAHGVYNGYNFFGTKGYEECQRKRDRATRRRSSVIKSE